MATITTQERTNILKLVAGMFNAAPGANYLNEFTTAYQALGNNFAGLATALGNTGAFKSLYPSTLTATEFATKFLTTLGLQANTEAAAWVQAKVNSGASFSSVILQAVAALDATSDSQFTAAKALLANKAAVAEYYSVPAPVGVGVSSDNLATLQNVFSKVTSDVTSVDAAKAAIVSGGNGQSNTLTTGQDVVNGTAGADIIRGVAGQAVGNQDQSTFNSSDIIDGGAGDDKLVINMTGPNYAGGATVKNIETLQIGTNLPSATFEYNVNQGSYEISGVNTLILDQINTGETLTINNLVRDNGTGALPTVSWINDSTAANGLAGTNNINYRAASVSGTADEQVASLTNVRAGNLNFGTGLEKVTLTSAGTATNSIATIDSANTLKDVVIKADAQLGGARVVSTAAGSIGLEVNQAPTNANTQHTSFVAVGASVVNVDATGSKAGVNIAFTDNATAVNNTFKGGDGNDTVVVAGGNDNLAGGKGDDTFIFRQTNTSSNGTFFNNSDTLDGGEGKDTILIDYAKDSASTLGQVTLQTSEWLNSKGLDVLDIRSTKTRVQLDDAFVSRADVGSFEVVTNKIVQNDSITSVADEANSRTQIDLTTVGANRAVKVTGGEGRETVIVTDALNGLQTITGGNGLDVLVVQNGATLTGQDLTNVSGVNVFNLVKTSAAAQTYNVDLTAAFLTAAVDSNVNAGTTKNTANAFRIVTDQRDAAFDTINGVQVLGANDVVNITIDTAGLTAAGAVNLNDLIASGATVNVRNTSGTVLLATATVNGVITVTTAGTGIFAGAAAAAAENTNYTDLVANAVTGAGTPVASGQASAGAGAGANVGNTFTLTAAGAALANTGTSINVTPAGNTVAGSTDTINATHTTFAGSVITDSSAADGDVLNLVSSGGTSVLGTLQGIENINLTVGGTSGVNLISSTGVQRVSINGGGTASVENANAGVNYTVNSTGQNVNIGALTAGQTTTVTLGAAYTGTITPTNYTTVNLVNSVGASAVTAGAATQYGLTADSTQALTLIATETRATAAGFGFTDASATARSVLSINQEGANGITLDLGSTAALLARSTGLDVIRFADDAVGAIASTANATTSYELVSAQAGVLTANAGLNQATGTTDNVTVTLNASAAATFAGITAGAAFEQLTINAVGATGTATVTAATAATGTANVLTITGNQALTIGAASGFEVINAAGYTGTALNITGAGVASRIVGSNAADTIDTGAFASTVTGGAGLDALTLNGTGNQVVNLAGSGLSSDADVITTFGSGADVLRITAAINNGTNMNTVVAAAGNTLALAVTANPSATLYNLTGADLSAATGGTLLTTLATASTFTQANIDAFLAAVVSDGVLAGGGAGGSVVTNLAANETVYLLVDNGTQYAVLSFNNANANATVDAGEIKLVAVAGAAIAATDLVWGAV